MLINSFFFNGFEISVYDSLNNELIDRWNEIDSKSLQSNYLKFIEDSKPVNLSFRYLLIEQKSQQSNKLCGIIYFQFLRFTNNNIRLNNSVLLSLVTRIVLKFRSFQFLICGNLLAVNFPTIKFNQNLISIKEVLGILSEIQKKENPDVFFLKDLDPYFTAELLSDFGWAYYPSDMTMTLNMDSSWKSLELYINSLTKKYRRRTEKILESGKDVEIRELNAQEILENIIRIGELFEQVINKQIVRMCLIERNYFYEFKKRFPDTFSFFGYYYKEKLIGFASYIEHNDELEIHYIGIDYFYNETLKIYFNILLDAVKLAIEKKKKILELGRTARQAKANIGAKPVYFNDFIGFKGRFANMLSGRLIKYFQSEIGEQWVERHPFRK